MLTSCDKVLINTAFSTKTEPGGAIKNELLVKQEYPAHERSLSSTKKRSRPVHDDVKDHSSVFPALKKHKPCIVKREFSDDEGDAAGGVNNATNDEVPSDDEEDAAADDSSNESDQSPENGMRSNVSG